MGVWTGSPGITAGAGDADRGLSRRRFLGSVMLATSSVALFGGCASPRYKIGAYTRAWGRRDYRVALDGMVATGYRFAALSVHDKGRVLDRDSTWDDAAAVREEVRSRGLELVMLSAGSFDLARPVDEGIAQLRRLVDLAVACGAPGLQVNDPAKPELEPVFYKVLGECCDYAADKRVGLTVHPHGSSGAHIRRQLDKVGHKHLRLLYDPGNVGYYSRGEIDPVDDAGALDGAVYGMSVKDFRLPPTVTLTPGTGLVDFPRLIARLRLGGLTSGPLMVECLDAGDLDYVNGEAKKAREWLETIIA